MLEIKGLQVGINNNTILGGIDLHVRDGESYIVFGPNGSGKTSLLSTIMGLPPYEVVSGEIRFRGKDISRMSIDQRSKFGIVMGFQHPPEISGVKLSELLKLCLDRDPKQGFSDEERRMIEAFSLTDFLDRDINVGFSGGERKRAEILQVIFLKPKLLLLDEPDSGVDVDSLKLIVTEIQRYIEESGSSALIITHKGDILDYIDARYACVILNGKSHCFQNPREIYDKIRRSGYEKCVTCKNPVLEAP